MKFFKLALSAACLFIFVQMSVMTGMAHDMSPQQMAAMPADKEAPVKHSAIDVVDHRHDESIMHEISPHEHALDQHSESAEGAETPTPEPLNKAIAQPATEPLAQVRQFQIIPNFHPIAVHFPIALTFIALLFGLAASIGRSSTLAPYLAATAHFTLWLAAIAAAVAVLFGWLAFNSVNHDDAGHAAMLLHRAWAVPTATGIILLACWDAKKHRVSAVMPAPTLVLLFLLSGAIAVTGWLGGEVVYRHGIGVLSLPASEGAGHSHHHEHGKAVSDAHPEHRHDDEAVSVQPY